MTASTFSPASTALTISSWPGRKALKPKTECSRSDALAGASSIFRHSSAQRAARLDLFTNRLPVSLHQLTIAISVTRRLAAIQRHHHAADVACAVRRQEHGEIGHFVGFGGAAERHVLGELRPALGIAPLLL